VDVKPDTLVAPLDRPLTDEERALLDWLLGHGFPGANELRSQIERLTVAGKCTCGCPTIYFAFDEEPVQRKGERVISDHLAEVDGLPVGVMVFETNGVLSSLEVYSLPGTDKPFGLPLIASILGSETSE